MQFLHTPPSDAIPGLSDAAKLRLATLTGKTPEIFYMRGDKGPWHPVNDIEHVPRRAQFLTNTYSAGFATPQGLERAHLADGLWLDIDSLNIDQAVASLGALARKLRALGAELNQCPLYATGGRGFHIFIPLSLLSSAGLDGVGLRTALTWPRVCYAFVESLSVRDVDMNIYSGKKGRMWRRAGLKRSNGLYKVPVCWASALRLDGAGYTALCSEPRPALEVAVPTLAPGAADAWKRAVGETLKRQQVAGIAQRSHRAVVGSNGRLLPQERQRIEAALKAMPELEYNDWLRVGSALKSSGDPDALDLWEAYSKRFGKYRPGECGSRWPGLSSTQVKLGTLFHIAREHAR